MNIYFSCSITGGRDDQHIYQQMVDLMVAQGHDVPTAHLSKADVLEDERVISALDVYQRDVNWVNQCDVLVAEVTTPSHGVGYEIALALQQGKPVLCCYQVGRKVSKMLLGNTSPSLSLYAYQDAQDVLAELERYLEVLSTST
jgi:nucleoside 2-deoxyribosyltransferase